MACDTFNDRKMYMYLKETKNERRTFVSSIKAMKWLKLCWLMLLCPFFILDGCKFLCRKFAICVWKTRAKCCCFLFLQYFFFALFVVYYLSLVVGKSIYIKVEYYNSFPFLLYKLPFEVRSMCVAFAKISILPHFCRATLNMIFIYLQWTLFFSSLCVSVVRGWLKWTHERNVEKRNELFELCELYFSKSRYFCLEQIHSTAYIVD